MKLTEQDPMDRAPEPFKPIKITNEEHEQFLKLDANKRLIPEMVNMFMDQLQIKMRECVMAQSKYWNSLLKKYKVDDKEDATYAYEPNTQSIIKIDEEV